MTRGIVLWVAVALAISTVAVTAKYQSAEELARIKAEVEALVLRQSRERDASIKGFARGVLSLEASRAFRRWDTANVLWKRERKPGAAPYLAEGVMWDCVSRLKGVVMPPLLSAEKFGGDQKNWEKARPDRAAKAFERALKEDPTLAEAQFRWARILAATDRKALDTLEQLAMGGEGELFAYLAAVSRAEFASSRGDTAAAIYWYQRAIRLHPRSVAASIALYTLNGTDDIALSQLDDTDPYYRYPCRILTAAVDAALTERMRALQ